MITPNSCEASEQLKMKYELYFPKFSYKITIFCQIQPEEGVMYNVINAFYTPNKALKSYQRHQ